MDNYSSSEVYNGHTIITTVYLNTGVINITNSAGVTLPYRTNTIVITDNNEPTIIEDILSENLTGEIATAVAGIKTLIDNIADPVLDAQLTDAGLTRGTGLDAPAGFTAINASPSPKIDLSWVNDVTADNYIIHQSEDPGFLDYRLAYTGSYAATITIISTYVISGTHYYFRVIAQQLGTTSSAPSVVDIIAT